MNIDVNLNENHLKLKALYNTYVYKYPMRTSGRN